MPFCPNCGKEYTSGQTVTCAACGNDLSAYEQQLVAQAQFAAAGAVQYQSAPAPVTVEQTDDREILRRFAGSVLVKITVIVLAVGVLTGIISCVFGFIGVGSFSLKDADLGFVEEVFEYTDDDDIDNAAVKAFVHEVEDFLAVSDGYSDELGQAASLLQVRPPVVELLLLIGMLAFVFSASRKDGRIKGIGLMRTAANLSYILIWLLFAVLICGAIVAMPWMGDKLIVGFYGIFSASSVKVLVILIIALALVLLAVVAVVGVFATIIGAKSSKMLGTWKKAANGGELIAPVSLQVLIMIFAVLSVEDAVLAAQMGLMTAAAVSALRIAALFLIAFCIGNLRKMKSRAVNKAAQTEPMPTYYAATQPDVQISEAVNDEAQSEPAVTEQDSPENSEV